MTQDFWNERYGEEDFAYGKTANDFLMQHFVAPDSKVLCLAEGEGRNGVYLAKMGCDVTCVDYSESGILKMKKLAEEEGVNMTCICADLNDYVLEPNQWDAIVIIFGHFPEMLRKKVHGQVFAALKPGGKLFLEAYRKEQIDYKTGGPMTTALLYSSEELRTHFSVFKDIQLIETIRDVREGSFHFGVAAVIQVLATK